MLLLYSTLERVLIATKNNNNFNLVLCLDYRKFDDIFSLE